MQDVSIHRLFYCAPARILAYVKTDTKTPSYPTPEQLYALELAARRARNAELARLAAAAAHALRAGLRRAVLVLNPKGVRHA